MKPFRSQGAKLEKIR